MSERKPGPVFRPAAGLSHTAIRTRNITESIRYYTEVLGLREAFRMFGEDGSLATVYLFLAPGQYLELFSGGIREGITGPEVTGFCHLCLMTKDIRESYEILPYDDFAAKICGEIRAKCKKEGTPAPFYDSQIAATAIANGMILVTHNTGDFEALRKNSMLKVQDWWG